MEITSLTLLVFQVIFVLLGILFFIFPTIGVWLLLKNLRNLRETYIATSQINELQQNDNAIVEDTNTALLTIVQRLEAIEERLNRDDRVIKGFK